MLDAPSRASGWELPNPVLRIGLTGQEDLGIRWLAEARSALEAERTRQVHLVDVSRTVDLRLIAGAADWAEYFIRHSREVGDPTPIVAINATAENGSNSRILEAGADDCLTCPFDAGELRARIQAVMRRIGNAWQRCPDIAADRATLRIRVCNVETRVSRKQFDVFMCLAEHRERWVHSDEIVATVCGTHHQPTSSLVRVQIHALRKLLGAERGCIRCDGHRSYMLTVSGTDPNAAAFLPHSRLTAK